MSTNTMQTDEKQELIEIFDNKNGRDLSKNKDILLMDKGHVISAVFDWDAWVESNEETIRREQFSETPTMVTGRSFKELYSYIFSSGGNQAFFTEDYIEMANELVGFDVKANLDRVRLFDIEDGPMLIEGDGFDVLLAPRIPPDDW